MKLEHRGMTINEILYHEGILDKFHDSLHSGNIENSIDILMKIGFTREEAIEVVDSNRPGLLSNLFNGICSLFKRS